MTIESGNQLSTFPRLEEHLETKIKSSTRINLGANNRIFKLVTQNGQAFIHKEYFDDDRNRLDREYSALDFLGKRGFVNLPKTITRNKDNNSAVYSYIEGSPKNPADLSFSDADQIVQFVTELQLIEPEHVRERFRTAVLGTDSLETFSNTVLFRLGRFSKYVHMPGVQKIVLDFSKNWRVTSLIESQLKRLKKQSPKTFINKLKPEERRFSPVDFGPHNMIFDQDRVNFIDFEYFGWDDPIKIIPNLILHEGSMGLPEQTAIYLLNKYIESSSIQSQLKERLNISLSLAALDWISILLWGLTPEKMSAKVFSKPDLNIEEHQKKQIAKIIRRLENLDTTQWL